MKNTTHDIDDEGTIGMNLTFCGGCGLESEDCKCDATIADAALDGEDEEEEL